MIDPPNERMFKAAARDSGSAVSSGALIDLADDARFLLSSLRPAKTGVSGAVVWIAAGEFSINEGSLGPRILVVAGDELSLDNASNVVAVLLSAPAVVAGVLPEQVRCRAVIFAEVNRDVLLEHWYGKADTWRTIEHLMPVRGG